MPSVHAMSERAETAILPPGKLPSDLLKRLIERYATADRDVLVGPGIGVDAAAIAVGGETLVVKSDPITFATGDAAWYLVNVNANDLACLGATPRWLLVTALLPEHKTTPELVETQFRQLHDACAQHGIALIGGHTEITLGLDRPILVGVLLGVARPGRLLQPGGARPGDRLLLTKAIAIEGTALLARELRSRLVPALGKELVDRAANLLVDPGISVVRDATALLDAGGVTALHDPTEGGLATGVRELVAAAGCGAFVNADVVPILPETDAIAAALGLDPFGILASGSLLAAVQADAVAGAIAAGEAAGLRVTCIGKVMPAEQGFTVISQRGSRELPVFASDEVTRVL